MSTIHTWFCVSWVSVRPEVKDTIDDAMGKERACILAKGGLENILDIDYYSRGSALSRVVVPSSAVWHCRPADNCVPHGMSKHRGNPDILVQRNCIHCQSLMADMDVLDGRTTILTRTI